LNADLSDTFTPGAHAGQLLTNSWSEPTDEEPPSRKQLPGEYVQPPANNGVPEQPNLPPARNALTNAPQALPADLSTFSREDLEKLVRSQSEEVIVANSEAQYFHKRWQDLHLSNEALGQDALTGDAQQLEDRLVEAVKEGYQGEIERRNAIKLMDKLVKTSKLLIQTAPHYDPKVRADYEVACRTAADLLEGHTAASIPLAGSLVTAQVADVNLDLRAVILNVGKSQGTIEGMPFIIYQNDEPIGIVKVVMVRPLVSLALIQNLMKGATLAKGDKAVVEAH
jgi:hypothetical protein